MCKPPEGCDYCAPQQAQCPPNDNYCRPPPSSECAQKFSALKSDMEALFAGFKSKMEEFNKAFQSDRQTYFQSQRTADESKAWNDAWMAKGKAIGDAFGSQWNAFLESKDLGACKASMPPPPMMGGNGGGGQAADRQYGSAPPQNNQFYAQQDEGRKLHEACMAEAGFAPPKGGQQPPNGPQGASGSPGQPGTPPQGAPPQGDVTQKPEFKAAMKACAEKVRAQFEQFYSKDAKAKDRKDEFGSFQMFKDGSTISVTGKYLSLKGDPNSQQMTAVTCGGQAFLDKVYVNGFLEDFGFDQTDEGTALRVKSAGVKVLELHDSPRCTINVATGATVSQITLDLADDLDVKKTEKGISFSDGSTEGRILLSDGTLDLAGNIVTVSGKATFFVSNSVAAKASGNALAGDLNIKAALEGGAIGAEVVVATEGSGVTADATPYGDLTVAVDDVANGVEAVVENADHDGKTIVLSFANDIFDDINLNVDVTDAAVAAATSEDAASAAAVEGACTNEADSLQDVLDPTDDDCNEYWVVKDKNGVQTLVSVTHFSAKKISITSHSKKGGLPAVGPMGAIVATVAAVVAIGVGVRRRRDD